MSALNATIDATPHNTSSHIVKLPLHIFGVIFDIIVSGPPQYGPSHKGKPWTELKSYSQVCTSWRGLILDSPTMWAKGVDIDLLFPMDHEFRNEYLRRTGEALLWVMGTDIEEDHKAVLFDVLEYGWHRIERLTIQLPFNTFVRADNKTWEIFSRTAPHLKIFRIFDTSHFSDGVEGRPNHFMLFKDEAPKLRVFDALFVIQNSLSENLSYVAFSDVQSVSEALAPLQHIKQLEFLSIGSTRVEGLPREELPVKPLEVQTLLRLELRVHINDCAVFMAHIIPGKGCSLNVFAVADGEWMEQTAPGESSELQREMLRYFNNYAVPNIVRGVEVEVISRPSFMFGAFVNVEDRGNQETLGPSFYFCLKARCGELYKQFLSRICENQAIKRTVEQFGCYLDSDNITSGFIGGNVRAMAKELPCVKFVGNLGGLKVMFDYKPDLSSQVPLPKLETVQLDQRGFSNITDEKASDLIMEALRKRRKTGHPLRILDITQVLQIFQDSPNLLRVVLGLKLRAQTPDLEWREYTFTHDIEELSDWIRQLTSLWGKHNNQIKEDATLLRRQRKTLG